MRRTIDNKGITMELNKKHYALMGVVLIACMAVYGYGVGADTQSLKFISGTEYQLGENAQVIVRVVDAWGNGINASYCNVTIYYPNKSPFVTNVAMTQGGATGSWYYNTNPDTQIGVYEEKVNCGVTTVSGARTIGAGSSFHVSQALTLINETASAKAVIVS